MRSVPGKHRECTDPGRAGFLEDAAGAVARRVPGTGRREGVQAVCHGVVWWGMTRRERGRR